MFNWEKQMKPLVIPVITLLVAIGCDNAARKNPISSSDAKPETVSSSTNVDRKDNTAVNERDRVSTAKTPIDQNENQKDIDITASIRKRVMDAKLSTNAHNSKIITQDGKVTLRGPVASEDEKKTIETIAVDIAGEGQVDNQLEIQP
jgi:hyperosmotically inducible protein